VRPAEQVFRGSVLPYWARTPLEQDAGRKPAASAPPHLPALYAVTGHRREPGTALHRAAIRGEPDAVRELLARGARTDIEDLEHHATPLGWAEYGRDVRFEPGGDHEAAVRALSATGG